MTYSLYLLIGLVFHKMALWNVTNFQSAGISEKSEKNIIYWNTTRWLKHNTYAEPIKYMLRYACIIAICYLYGMFNDRITNVSELVLLTLICIEAL